MNLVLIGILICEIGFWVLLFGGLATRYLLRRTRLSTVLLLGVPVLDLLLLALLVWEMLVNEAVATFIHGLGAVYLGFTVAFGRSIITRVDAWFAHRFADGPAPVKIPKHGRARVRHEWREWGKLLVCAAITSVILGAIILIVADPARTAELYSWFPTIGLVTGVWLLGWPVWVTVEWVLKGEPRPDDARA